MENKHSAIMKRSSVAILSDKNDFIIPLVKKLFNSHCSVDIIGDKYILGSIYTKALDNDAINIISPKAAIKEKYKYLLFCYLLQNKHLSERSIRNDVKTKLSLAKTLLKKEEPRFIFIFPYIYNKRHRKIIDLVKEEIISNKEIQSSSIFLGQLIGTQANIDKDDPLLEVLKQTIQSSKVYVIKNLKYYPISINRALREILKLLFSFKKKNVGNTVYSEELSAQRLVKILKGIRSEAEYVYLNKESIYEEASVKKSKIINENINQEIKKTWKQIFIDKNTYEDKRFHEKQRPKRDKKIWKIRKQKKSRNKKVKRRSGSLSRSQRLIFFLLFVLLLPLILSIINLSSYYFGRSLLSAGYLSEARAAYTLSKNSLIVNNSYLKLLRRLPLIDKINDPLISYNDVFIKTIEVEEKQIVILDYVNNIVEKALNKEEYDIKSYAGNIKVELDYLHKQLGFLISEVSDEKELVKNILKIFINVNDLIELHDNIPNTIQLINELPVLLGEEKAQTYAVLYQDNSIIKPTGGKIEAVGLITFNEGRVAETEFLDVDYLDNQLKGFVEPPSVIKEYVEGSWTLKNSNWDPDYPESARKVGWFIDKTIEKQISGVIAIDNNFIYELINNRNNNNKKVIETEEILEKLNISNKNIESTTSDYYGDILKESYGEFFQNSQKRRTSFFNRVPNLVSRKNILIFLNNIEAQRSIDELGVTGALPSGIRCDNCHNDWLAVIETNLNSKVNNNDIIKNYELETAIEERVLKRRLLVTLQNKSERKDPYLTSVRAVTTPDSSFSPVKFFRNDEVVEIYPKMVNIRGHSEADVVISVKAQETISLLFVWESQLDLDFTNSGKYSFLWFKQPGTKDENIQLKFIFPRTIKESLARLCGLTEDETLDYNTELSRDFISLIYW